MWDVFVYGHFDALWIDDNETHIRRSVSIKQRHDKGVCHNGFTRTSGTGDKEMAHIGEIGKDGFARYVLPYGKSKRGFDTTPFF